MGNTVVTVLAALAGFSPIVWRIAFGKPRPWLALGDIECSAREFDAIIKTIPEGTEAKWRTMADSLKPTQA